MKLKWHSGTIPLLIPYMLPLILPWKTLQQPASNKKEDTAKAASSINYYLFRRHAAVYRKLDARDMARFI